MYVEYKYRWNTVWGPTEAYRYKTSAPRGTQEVRKPSKEEIKVVKSCNHNSNPLFQMVNEHSLFCKLLSQQDGKDVESNDVKDSKQQQ